MIKVKILLTLHWVFTVVARVLCSGVAWLQAYLN